MKLDERRILLRPMGEDDIDFLCRLYISTRLEEMSLSGWPEAEINNFLTDQFQLQHFQYLKKYPAADFDIITFESEAVGRLYVERKENEIRVIDISLLPEFRGQKIGSTLFELLITEAELREIPLTLHVEHNNPIRNFYERLGFKIEKDLGVYLLMKRDMQLVQKGEQYAY